MLMDKTRIIPIEHGNEKVTKKVQMKRYKHALEEIRQTERFRAKAMINNWCCNCMWVLRNVVFGKTSSMYFSISAVSSSVLACLHFCPLNPPNVCSNASLRNFRSAFGFSMGSGGFQSKNCCAG